MIMCQCTKHRAKKDDCLCVVGTFVLVQHAMHSNFFQKKQKQHKLLIKIITIIQRIRKATLTEWKRCRMSKGDSKTQIAHMNIHERNVLCFFSYFANAIQRLQALFRSLARSLSFISLWFLLSVLSITGIGVFASKIYASKCNYMPCTKVCVTELFCPVLAHSLTNR